MATPDAAKRPIVIRRKKAGGHGHHGGAWKVAYADFVTAMMALFIVLWLMASDEAVKAAVAGYFRDPAGVGKAAGAGPAAAVDSPKESMAKLQERIEQALRELPAFGSLKDHVEMTITSEGLRIELLESDGGVFFESGKTQPNPIGAELLTKLAEEIGKLPNTVSIEGHTDAKPFPGGEYSNWELSADRGNSARKIMQAHGLRDAQVTEVRGYADRRLRYPQDPEAAANRRISLIVRHQLVK